MPDVVLHGCELVTKGAPADWPAWLLRGRPAIPGVLTVSGNANSVRTGTRRGIADAKERVACAPEGSRTPRRRPRFVRESGCDRTRPTEPSAKRLGSCRRGAVIHCHPPIQNVSVRRATPSRIREPWLILRASLSADLRTRIRTGAGLRDGNHHRR